jgi:hypothetical protein
MRKTAIIMFLAGITLLGLSGNPAQSAAGIITTGFPVPPPPPPLVLHAPPPVILIPGSYAYFVPDIEVAILFYHGFWYRPYEGHWYRARHYNGPWGYLGPSRVPRALRGLPYDYRGRYHEHRHIPYGQLKKNWNRWERERYWDTHDDHDEGRHDDGRDHGRGRDDDRHTR